MCKFHKDVARAIATDPVTQQFNPGKFAVALVAMASFRIEQYMPAMHGCDGFVPAQMTTEVAVESFEKAGLKPRLDALTSSEDGHIALLRNAMANIADRHDLDLRALNIPDNITRDGYKHCAKMDADPTKAGPFLDEAVVQLFEGYDDTAMTWARGALTLTPRAHKPEFENIRKATADFMAQPGAHDALKQMFELSLIRIFSSAQEDLQAGKGLDKTDGCVMCGHGSRAETVKPAENEKPAASSSLAARFNDCACTVRDGLGGAVLSHVGCIATPVLAGVFGLAVSGPFLAGMMLVTAPAIAMAATWGLARLRGEKTTGLKLAGSAGIAVAMAMAISTLTGGHDNHAGGHHEHHQHEHHQHEAQPRPHQGHHMMPHH